MEDWEGDYEWQRDDSGKGLQGIDFLIGRGGVEESLHLYCVVIGIAVSN